MTELVKNLYNLKFFEGFSQTMLYVVPDFEPAIFIADIFDEHWDKKEFKQRTRHLAAVLAKHLPQDFKLSSQLIIKIIEQLKEVAIAKECLEYIFLPDFIEVYGQDDYAISIKALEAITQFISCEFAVRPFILKYPDEMMAQMLVWSQHSQPRVRRLASEGCRPRLPWAAALVEFKKNPAPIIPILENLKNDAAEDVRRSVANNLNDISKDNPQTVRDLVKKWQHQTKETDWILKHACRSLLKAGDKQTLVLFNLGSIANIKIKDFKLHMQEVRISESLEFSFKLENSSTSPKELRLEYGIFYQKSRGKLARKVFKISQKYYPANAQVTITRKQPFRLMTTRVLYCGEHQISLIVNGVELDKLVFKLI